MKLSSFTIILFGILLTPFHGFAKEPVNEKIIKSVNAYYPNGEQKGALRSVHTFDKKGNLIEYKSFLPNGSLQYAHEYTYDKKGRVTNAHNWAYRFGFSETMQRYEFNRKGEVIASHHYQNGAYMEQKHYVYKKKKSSLCYTHTPQGKLVSKKEINQKEHSILPLQIHPTENNHLTEIEYYKP